MEALVVIVEKENRVKIMFVCVLQIVQENNVEIMDVEALAEVALLEKYALAEFVYLPQALVRVQAIQGILLVLYVLQIVQGNNAETMDAEALAVIAVKVMFVQIIYVL